MWIVVVKMNRSQLLFFVFFRRGEVSSEALSVVKKVGFALWKKIMKNLCVAQLTWVFVLQDKSKSSVSKIVVSIPTECEALLVGTVFLIHIEILTVIIVTGKKNQLQGHFQTIQGQKIRRKCRLRPWANRCSSIQNCFQLRSVRTRERSACQGLWW